MSRAGVEALGLLRRDVRELRHTILFAVWWSRVRSSRARAGLWLLPTCRRWFGCPFVLDRVREIEPVLRRRPVEQPHDASHAELLIVSSRRLRFARWAAHLPVKRASGFPARAARVFCILISPRLGRDRSERRPSS